MPRAVRVSRHTVRFSAPVRCVFDACSRIQSARDVSRSHLRWLTREDPESFWPQRGHHISIPQHGFLQYTAPIVRQEHQRWDGDDRRCVIWNSESRAMRGTVGKGTMGRLAEKADCGFSAPDKKNLARPAQQGEAVNVEKDAHSCNALVTCPLASFLRLDDQQHMFPFRVVVVSIVLTLAVEPATALLCRAWCHPQVAAASACHQEKPSATSSVVAVASCEECEQRAVGAAPFLRKDVQRIVSNPDVDHSNLLPRYQFAQLTIDARPRYRPGRQKSLERRSLAIVLRI